MNSGDLLTVNNNLVILYSHPASVWSHRVRIVLEEKDIEYEIKSVEHYDSMPEDLLDINAGKLPTLVDRDLILWGSQVIMEYFDERYPNPGLMPNDPMTRGRCRLMLYRIEREWAPLIKKLQLGEGEALKALVNKLVALNSIFEEYKFYMSDDYSLVDVSLSAILWLMHKHGVKIPASAKAVHNYCQRLFERPSFDRALSEIEKSYVG